MTISTDSEGSGPGLPDPRTGPRVASDKDYTTRVIPRGPAPRSLRCAAAVADVLLVAVPLVVGWLIVNSLRDDNGGGQADRVVFGGLAVVVAVALFIWNTGFRDGRTGRSAGKNWFGIVLRDKESGSAIGPGRAIRVRTPGAEVVRLVTATDEGFEAIEPTNTVAATRRRRMLGLTILVIALVTVAAMSVAIGARPLTFAEIAHALFSSTGLDTDIVVRTLRVPRTVIGFVAGVSLGIAGALIQGHTRNPLADAGLLGLNAGAAFFVVMAIYLFGFASPSQYLWFAFVGSAVASVVVFGLSSIGSGRSNPLTLALAGAAVAFFLQAMTDAVVLLDQTTLDGYRFWVVGSVAGRGTDILFTVLPFIVVGILIALASTPNLNTLSLGDDVARSLGTNIGRTRVVGIVAITLLTGAATAACGPIAFVGLVVPHIARAITGPDYRWLVPYSGLMGGVLLVLADVIGRVVVRPGELQVGIVLALIGAPFFVGLIRRRKLATL